MAAASQPVDFLAEVRPLARELALHAAVRPAAVSSYDWLISLVFMPLGFLLAGPLADAIGVGTTLLLAPEPAPA